METQNSLLADLSFLTILPDHFMYLEDVDENSDWSSFKQSRAVETTGPFLLLGLALVPVKTMAKETMWIMQLAFLPGYTQKAYETPELLRTLGFHF